MNIRTATIKDLEAVTSVEAECFPPAEAATREELAERLKYYADHFWLMFDGDKLIAFVDGFVTDEEDLTDDYELVAVIAAAIAASEGAASTDGFVVRSIRRANTSKWKANY